MPQRKMTTVERAASGDDQAVYDRLGDMCPYCAIAFEIRGTYCDEHLGYKYVTQAEAMIKDCGHNMGVKKDV